MVAVDSHGISRVPRYSGACREPACCRLRGCHPLWPIVPDRSTNQLLGNSPALKPVGPYNPDVQAHRFGLCPRSLAATSGITIVFCSSRYRDGSLPSVAFTDPMNSGQDTRALTHVGFPIRTSPGQSLFAAHRSFSQLTTSFIDTCRQGIHRTPLVA